MVNKTNSNNVSISGSLPSWYHGYHTRPGKAVDDFTSHSGTMEVVQKCLVENVLGNTPKLGHTGNPGK